MLSNRIASIWMFLLITLSSRASIPANSDGILLAFTILTSFIFFTKNETLTSKFVRLIIGFLFLTIIYFIIFQSLQIAAYARLLLKLFLAFFILGIYKDKFTYYAEKIIFYLAFLSLPLFTLQLLLPNTLHEYNAIFENVLPFLDINGAQESNSFIFNIEIVGAPHRNSGFAWEPGGFSAFLSLALFFNLNLNHFRFNKRFLTMLIADLTTQSTTGYIVLVFIFVYWVYNRYRFNLIWLSPFMFIFFVFLSNLSFVGKEIEEEFYDHRTVIDFEKNYKDQEFVSLGRMGSFVVDFNDFEKYPFIGYGMEEHKRTQGSYTKLMRTNGLTEHLVRFGLCGILFWVFALYKFHTAFLNSTRGIYIFIFCIFVTAFSNPILDEKFFLCLIIAWTLDFKNKAH